MNLRYQETFCIIFLLCTSITLGEDFDFVPESNDDVETGVHCLPTEKTIQLSVSLRSKHWKHVSTDLKQRTITKLAEYFSVPEIACGEMSARESEEIVRNLERHLGELDSIIDIDIFSTKKAPLSYKKQTRPKREVEVDDEYDYDYDDEDDQGDTTEIPHARRHHHGSSEYSTKSAHSSPTHATNKHTNSDGHVSEKHHHHQQQHQQQPQQNHAKHHSNDGKVMGHGRGGTSEHRKSPVMVSVTSSTTTATLPKHKHNHGLYDQVKERSAKKHAAALGHNRQPEHNVKPVTEPSIDGGSFTPPDLRESVSQLESTISKTIANNEQLKKDEETLLARKSKHKRIDIERIVETELLLPEIERLQDEVFRDDYVIEDVVRGPKFYDYSTQPQLDGVGKFVPLEPQVDAGKQLTSTVTSVNRSTLKLTTVKPVSVTVRKSTTASPITTTSRSVPSLNTLGSRSSTSEGTTQPSLTVTVRMQHKSEAAQSFLTTKLPHPAVTPVVSSIDADEDEPSRSDVTTTIGTISMTSMAPVPHHKSVPMGTSSILAKNEEQPATQVTPATVLTTTPFTRAKAIPTNSMDMSSATATIPVTTVSTTTASTTTTITEGTTNSAASFTSATNTRSTNTVASVPLVKVS
uniref:Uncharacterized protein n=1 Tax=Anopheles culicifacies TaxID=139723 RepID=A0A182MPN2_9DIPT